MKILEAAFVGYPVTDIPRARHFYEKILGLTVGEIDEVFEGGKIWVEYELGNMTLAISNLWEPTVQSGPTLALEVDDLDSAIAELKEAGVTLTSEAIASPVCRFALLNDPDGNPLMIHQRH